MDVENLERDISDYDFMKNKTKKCARLNRISSVLPILNWLPFYKIKFLPQDIIAGLTVGLTTVPQSIAYSTLAGLPPEYGLYSAVMGCFVYVLFGTCKDISVGPTAIMALMVQPYVETGNADYAVLCCFIIGCVITLMGILNLGALMQFISAPVTIGFTMAAGITIVSSQINNLFGVKSPPNNIIGSWTYLFTHLKCIRFYDSLLGLFTVALLILIRKIQNIHWKFGKVTRCISLARNALAVFIGIVLCYLMTKKIQKPFITGDQITPGLPSLKWPPFSTNVNGTAISTKQMISRMGGTLLLMPIISILESIAVAKAFSEVAPIQFFQSKAKYYTENIRAEYFMSFRSDVIIISTYTRIYILFYGDHASFRGLQRETQSEYTLPSFIWVQCKKTRGKIVKATQEMIALGMCNIVSSIFSSMPISGSFTRTAINNSSGALTPLGGVITGALVIMTLMFLTKPFYYLPKATLAAVIIAAVISMIECHQVLKIWRAKKVDIIPFDITLMICLFWSLEFGIIFGIIVNLVFILYRIAKPEMTLTTQKINNTYVAIVSVRENLSYASAEYLKVRIFKFLKSNERGINAIVITGVNKPIDSTVGLNVISLEKELLTQNCEMFCWNWNAEAVNVVCRLKSETYKIFYTGENLEEIFRISS